MVKIKSVISHISYENALSLPIQIFHIFVLRPVLGLAHGIFSFIRANIISFFEC